MSFKSIDSLGNQIWARLQSEDPDSVERWLRKEHPDLITRINRLTVVDQEFRLDQVSQIVPTSEARKLPRTDQPLTVYRGVPYGGLIRPGDWISLTRDYAEQHAQRVHDKPCLDSLPLVDPTDVFWAGTDMSEFFYLPMAWRKPELEPAEYLAQLTRDQIMALADGERWALAMHEQSIAAIRDTTTQIHGENEDTDLHGPGHWARVSMHGMAVARSLGINPLIPVVFGLVHDSQRKHDGIDPLHGPRAMAFIRARQSQLFGFLAPQEVEDLCTACDQHSDAVTHGSNPVIACFDADRLDLGRVRVCPDPGYLCTEYAKRPTIIANALRMVNWDEMAEEVLSNAVTDECDGENGELERCR